ncbi:nuclear transport factor 2 family protein [Terrihabitans sp. B22-R8]|uniref:nuclear transport factor 2 family protein n=1 Tax=Terrihabitans sp. B22-R8 TaxID=3425128 RepID=UPI00403C517A
MTEASSADQMGAVRAVIERYLDAVRNWDEAGFRATFDPKANIAHYYVKGDEIRTLTLNEFVETIGALHSKFDNAEEKAKEIDIRIVDHIASVRVPFAFVMGERTLEGQDLFNLALCKGEWKIMHKSYYL